MEDMIGRGKKDPKKEAAKRSGSEEPGHLPDPGLGLRVTKKGYLRADGTLIPRKKEHGHPPSIVHLTNEPRCPDCRERLDLVLKQGVVAIAGYRDAQEAATGRASAIYCSNCGHTFSIAIEQRTKR